MKKKNMKLTACMYIRVTLSRNERGRFGALKSDSTHHFFIIIVNINTDEKKSLISNQISPKMICDRF
jgi:hypothetical protein